MPNSINQLILVHTMWGGFICLRT